jgi:hypothetical protein
VSSRRQPDDGEGCVGPDEEIAGISISTSTRRRVICWSKGSSVELSYSAENRTLQWIKTIAGLTGQSAPRLRLPLADH